MREIEVQAPFVDALALPDREHAQLVRVVRHDENPCVRGLTVDGDAQAARPPHEHRQRSEPGERDVLVLLVDEAGVEPERDVVQEEPVVDPPDVHPQLAARKRPQAGFGVVPVEAEIAREVVERAERNDDEGRVALESDLGDGGQRAVAARDSKRALGRLPRHARGILAGPQEMRFETEPLSRGAQSVRVLAPPGARVDHEEAAHRVSIAVSPRQRRPREPDRANRRRARAVERPGASLLQALELRPAEPRRALVVRR